MKDGVKEIQNLSGKVADYFCEPQKTFKLDECLKTIKSFCEKVQNCQKVRNMT